MLFGVLGSLEVLVGGEPVRVPRRAGELLGVLLAGLGSVVSVDALALALWGDDLPRDPEAALRSAVYRLRQALGPGGDVVVRRGVGYVLDVDADAVDAVRFERKLAEARRLGTAGDLRVAEGLIGEALGLWRGAAYEDFRDAEFAQSEIVRLEELRVTAVELLMEARVGLGNHAEVIPELQSLVAEFPLRERLWGLLMVALHRSGRTGEALRAFGSAKAALGELGIEPGVELRTLEESFLLEDPSLHVAEPSLTLQQKERAGGNLPVSLTSFVGRDAAVGEVAELVGKRRLVTLTGMGGIGKTRLALQVAGEMTGKFAGGVWLVELAPVGDAAAVPSVVAQALEVAESPTETVLDSLVAALAERELLVVLDNCEHLVEAAAKLAERLLRQCPGLRVVATSREPLGVDGEAIFATPPLATPEDDGAAKESEAVQLFRDRAALTGTVIDEASLGGVAEVCRRLDGIPLAIELAAAWLKALSLDQVAELIDDRFRLLTDGARTVPERQQTLQATMDWSHDLLTGHEQILLRRLAVFEGGFTLDAAETICGFDPLAPFEILHLVARLVATSLVTRDDTTPGRFRMLETVRQYGAAQLDEAGEATTVRDRHLDHYSKVADGIEDGLLGPDQTEWQARLSEENDNLHAALEHAAHTGATDTAVHLVVSISRWWDDSSQYTEGRRWQNWAADVSQGQETIDRVILLGALTYFETWAGNIARAETLATEAVELSHLIGSGRALAYALNTLGVAVSAGAKALPVAIFEEALQEARASGARRVGILINLTRCYIYTGDYDRAQQAVEELQQLPPELQEPRQQVWIDLLAGDLAYRLGELDVALAHYGAATPESAPVNPRHQVAGLHRLGWTLLWLGQLDKAQQTAQQAIDLAHEIEAEAELAECHLLLGAVAARQRDTTQALHHLSESLHAIEDSDRLDELARTLEWLALITAELPDPVAVARLASAADAFRGQSGVRRDRQMADALTEATTKARAMLDDRSEGIAAGAAMTRDDAMSYAFQLTKTGGKAPHRSPDPER